VPIALLHLSIHPHTHIVTPTGQTSVKCDIGDFHENLSGEPKFGSNQALKMKN